MRDSWSNKRGIVISYVGNLFSDVSRATWNDCGAASWNGMRDVQEANGGTNERDAEPGLIRSRFHERERETVFTSVHRHYGNLARIRKRWPPVIQKFAGYGGTFTNDEGNFISSVYLSGNPRDTVREHVVFCIRATLYRLILNADNVISMRNWASCHSVISI